MFHRFTVDDNRTNDSSITTEVDAPFLLHQLEKRTTEERYDWYEAKSLKRASMSVSSENLTN